MTAESLKTCSLKKLATLAKKRGVSGWQSMRKEQLVTALLRLESSAKPRLTTARAGMRVAPKKPKLAAVPTRRAASVAVRKVSKPTKALVTSKKPSVIAKALIKTSAIKAPAIKAHTIKTPSLAKSPSKAAPTKPIIKAAAIKTTAIKTVGKSPAVKASDIKTRATNKVAPLSKAAPLNKAVPSTKAPIATAVSKGAMHTPAGANGAPRPAVKPSQAAVKSALVQKRLAELRADAERRKNIASAVADSAKDRLVVMVRGPYWLHAYWELTTRGVERAEAAMGQEWHSAKPILRVFEVFSDGTTTNSERPIRDIEIHGDVNTWYIDVQKPPRGFRLAIGYRGTSGKFFVLARSNVVHTPASGASDAMDENWVEVAADFDKIFAMSGGYTTNGAANELQDVLEERLRRPMGAPLLSKLGPGATVQGRRRGFHFEIDAELIVFGKTDPSAHVKLQGEPVKLRSDGTFTVRYSMPNIRQVIPAVASSADGVEQRTVILAVERNTKMLEPLVRDNSDA